MTKITSNWLRSSAFVASLLYATAIPSALAMADEQKKRIVSIGGSVTEIVYALGEQSRLIARDSTSLFPKEATALPDVGYIRRLSPEGVLSVEPDMIISLEGAGPPEAVDVLRSANIELESIPEKYDAAGIINKIEQVGRALNTPKKASALATDVQKKLKQLATITQSIKQRKKVLFVLSMSGGRVLASGKNTAAAGVIALAGAENAISGFEGYKALTDEAIINAAPDAILMMNRRGDHSTNNSELFAHPAIALTPAAKSKTVLKMDGLYLLGFGPRTPSAAKELASTLYGEALVAN